MSGASAFVDANTPGCYWGFLRYLYTTPHVNKTTNALYLDGHAVTFDYQYLKTLYQAYCNNFTGSAHFYDPNDPFHNP